MSLIINGKAAPCAVPIRDWRATGMEFSPPKGCRPRRDNVDLIVLHWTGGEGDAERVFKTLQNRRLGIEFIIDADGHVFQCADPGKVDTYDAGAINRRSAGVEIVNYGFRSLRGIVPRRGRNRPTYQTVLNGHKTRAAAFWPEQIDSAIALCAALSDAFDIPRLVPRNADGTHADRVLEADELDAFKGTLGHYHVARHKSDPGTAIFRELEIAGWR